MLKIKSPPNHNKSAFIDVSANIKFLELFELDEKGYYKPFEHECEVDGKLAIIRPIDYMVRPLSQLTLINFIIMQIYGFGSVECQSKLLQKYGNKINQNTLIAIVQYELVEFI